MRARWAATAPGGIAVVGAATVAGAGRGAVLRRLTAVSVALLGVTNAVLGVLVVIGAGELRQVPPATGWGLVLGGPLLATLGVLAWRGGRRVMGVLLGVLLVLLVAHSAFGATQPGGVGRTLLLVALTALAGLAWREADREGR
jgi:hypothetical protein